jgi:hypothetical protein
MRTGVPLLSLVAAAAVAAACLLLSPLPAAASCSPVRVWRGCVLQRVGTGLVIKGSHRLVLDAPTSAAATFRPLMDAVYTPPVVAYTPLPGTPVQWAGTYTTQYCGLVRCCCCLSARPRPWAACVCLHR